ncbi:hypothetical protein [Rubinisphaera margarita]|uniref:hypothetical protein n=1 Tax=Rubinisphaera margarita TaxID=2909586 RepID=UPI001EE8D2C4|nr:hypothetical protein [Rubinisphaera margarita]MCG6156522.1 hypothetical protein [Rubinisphaera margarita]
MKPKSLQSVPNDVFDTTRIESAIKDLSTFWNEVHELGRGPMFEEFGRRIDELRQRLVEHFVYTEQRLESLRELGEPIATSEFDQILRQHAEFLDRLAVDVERLRAQETPFMNWVDVGREFDLLVERLDQIERNDETVVDR